MLSTMWLYQEMKAGSQLSKQPFPTLSFAVSLRNSVTQLVHCPRILSALLSHHITLKPSGILVSLSRAFM